VEVVGESVVVPESSEASPDESVSNSEALPDFEPPVVSLLSMFKAPTASDLSMKRKILKNPFKGKKRSSCSCVLSASLALRVKPSQGVKE